MPYRSKAQKEKFHALAKAGKISQEIVDAKDKASAGLEIPERISPKKSKSIADIRAKASALKK